MGPKGHTKKEKAMYMKKYGKKGMSGHKKKSGKKYSKKMR